MHYFKKQIDAYSVCSYVIVVFDLLRVCYVSVTYLLRICYVSVTCLESNDANGIFKILRKEGRKEPELYVQVRAWGICECETKNER
jgi:hypothetical protein